MGDSETKRGRQRDEEGERRGRDRRSKGRRGKRRREDKDCEGRGEETMITRTRKEGNNDHD